MTKDREEQEPSFKVVDRRRFIDDAPEESPHQSPSEAPDQGFGDLPQATESPRMPMSFSIFIQSLAHQAMMGLGLVPWPDSGLVRTELSLAKETIDLLEILESKTTGNLLPDEQNLVEGLLYQLRMVYVEIANKDPKSPSLIK